MILCDDGVIRPPWAATDPLLRAYYDDEWGVLPTDERGMFEALSLEVFQAGLSWSTVLRKRANFRQAFANFEPAVVAAFSEADVARLLTDEGIIRNERKIRATIRNASATVALREAGGLHALVLSSNQEPTAPEAEARAAAAKLAAKLKGHGFSFVGPTSVYALMQAVGMVDGKRDAQEQGGTLKPPHARPVKRES